MQLSKYNPRIPWRLNIGTTPVKCIFHIQINKCLKAVCYISPESGKNDVDLGV